MLSYCLYRSNQVDVTIQAGNKTSSLDDPHWSQLGYIERLAGQWSWGIILGRIERLAGQLIISAFLMLGFMQTLLDDLLSRGLGHAPRTFPRYRVAAFVLFRSFSNSICWYRDIYSTTLDLTPVRLHNILVCSCSTVVQKNPRMGNS